MDRTMSRWGVGPVFALLSLAYAGLIMALNRYFGLHIEIAVLPRQVLFTLAAVLIAAGVPFLIFSLISLHHAYNSGKLVTTGIFGCCRNPIYAAWIIFLAPGMMLLRDDWLGMTLPLFMYVVLRLLVVKEEKYLEKVFGEEYLEYKKKVMRIMPLSWIRTIYRK